MLNRLTNGDSVYQLASNSLTRSADDDSGRGVKIISFKYLLVVFPRVVGLSGYGTEAIFDEDHNCSWDHFQKVGELQSRISLFTSAFIFSFLFTASSLLCGSQPSFIFSTSLVHASCSHDETVSKLCLFSSGF